MMILYNTYSKTNNFGFDDINHQAHNIIDIRALNIERATPRFRKNSNIKLSNESIHFLKFLGFKAKRN